MPEPLQYRRTEPASMLIGLTFVVPPILLVILWLRGGALAPEPRLVNVAAHTLALLVAGAWASVFFRRIHYRSSNERVLGSTSFFSELGASWWMSALMWPAPLLALLLLGRRVVEVLTMTGPPLRSTPADLFLLWLTMIVLLAVWVTSLRERADIRVSEEGLRTNNLHFTEWARLDHVVRRGPFFDLCHAANPRLPFSTIRLTAAEPRAVLLDHLERHHIRVTDTSSAAYHVLRLVVALGLAAELAGGAALQQWIGSHAVNRLWSVVVVFLVGLGATFLLERYRGLRHITSLKPQVEPAEPGDDAGGRKDPGADS